MISIYGYTHDDRARWSPKGYVRLASIIPPMDTRTTPVHGARSSCVYQAKCYIFFGGVCLTGAPQRVTSDLNVDPAGMYLSIYLYISYISTSLLYVYKLTSLLYLHPAGMYLRYISYIYAFYMHIPMICIYDLYLISTSPLYHHPAGMHLRLYLYIPYVHPAGMTLCI